MKTVKYLFIISFFTMLACGTSKPATQAEIDALNALVNSKMFKIESDWAYPQLSSATQQVLNSGIMPPGSSSGSINLIGNSNFLKISGDSITSYLPYFGERQMNVGYGGSDSAIEFIGVVEDYKTNKGKGESTLITFGANTKTENFNVTITLWPNLNSEILLNSTSRALIRYTGKVEAVKKED